MLHISIAFSKKLQGKNHHMCKNRSFVSIFLVNSYTLLTLQKCSALHFDNPFQDNNWPHYGGLVGSTKPQYFTLAYKKAYHPHFKPMVYGACVGAWGGWCLVSYVSKGLRREEDYRNLMVKDLGKGWKMRTIALFMVSQLFHGRNKSPQKNWVQTIGMPKLITNHIEFEFPCNTPLINRKKKHRGFWVMLCRWF